MATSYTPYGLAFNPTYQMLYMGTGTSYITTISVQGGVGAQVLASWDSGNVAIQTRGLAVDPVLGALYMSDNNVNYYIGKNWLPCGSLPTAPTNGGLLGTCVSLMDQGSQCQFTCNTVIL